MKITSKTRNVRRGTVLSLLATVGILSIGASPGQAEEIRFRFTAEATSVPGNFPPGLSVGDTIAGTYTIESTTPDSAPSAPRFGIYDGVFTAAELTFAGETQTLASGKNRIRVGDDTFGGFSQEDSLFLNVSLTGDFNLQVGMHFNDLNTFGSDALPVVAPALPQNHSEGHVEFLIYARGVAKSPHARARLLSLELDTDATPPEVSASVAEDVLWSPNHKLQDVGLSFSVEDDEDPNPTVAVLVYSNEAGNGAGDGNTVGDAAVGADGSLSLRAERSGKGSGRVYLVVVAAMDADGNTGYDCATVMVPKSKSKRDLAAVVAAAEAAEEICEETGAAPEGWHPLN